MLISLTIQNCRSFAEAITFSLVKGRSKQHENRVIKGSDGLDLLPLALVFGANAAGKSNLVNAVRDARQIVIGDRSVAACYFPHKLDESLGGAPTHMEFVFRASGSVLQYRFSFKGSAVVAETLSVLPNDDSNDKIVFSRNGGEFVLSGIGLTGKEEALISFIAQSTPNDKLFLTELSERDVFEKLDMPEIEGAFKWFEETLVTKDSQELQLSSSLPKRLNDDSEFCARVSDAVSSIDVGIKRMVSNTHEMNDPPDFMLELGAGWSGAPGTYFEKQDDKVVAHIALAERETRQGNRVFFNLSEESSGTRRFIQLIPTLAECQDKPRVFFVDELDNNLHPLLTKHFLENFLFKGAESQMIATTHESTLLSNALIRRDEIWIVEKLANGSSELKSVEDYKIRPDLDMKRAYLDGRFGGIPLVQDTTWIWENVETERKV